MQDGNAPRAFLNLIFLPEHGNISLENGTSFAFDQLSASATQAIGQSKNQNFDALNITDFVAPDDGYVMVYVSNESNYITEVYFDDLQLTINEHPVIQTDDYYPFGLQFNSYSRVTSKQNDYLYNGKEKQTALNLGWYDYGARMYMPDIGRWGVIDPLADSYYSWSPFNYAINNPIRNIDPDGRGIIDKIGGFFQKVKNFVTQGEFKTNGRIKYEKAVAEYDYANDVNGWISEVNDLNNFNIDNVNVPMDPDAPTISEHKPDILEQAESALEIKENDGLGTKTLKTIGNLAYSTVNDPYSAYTGESLGGDNLSASEREDAVGGTVLAGVSALKPVKAIKTLNMGQYTKGKSFSSFREAGQALIRRNNSARNTNRVNNAAVEQGTTAVEVVDVVTGTVNNGDN